MVRIRFPPAVSQGRTRPRGLALLEATIVSERPMMRLRPARQTNSLNSIVPDLADEVGPTLLQRQRERSRPAGPHDGADDGPPGRARGGAVGGPALLQSRIEEAIIWYEKARNATPARPGDTRGCGGRG